MPNKDGTGPEGEGPLTGRGMGDCEAPEESKEEVQTTLDDVTPEEKVEVAEEPAAE